MIFQIHKLGPIFYGLSRQGFPIYSNLGSKYTFNSTIVQNLDSFGLHAKLREASLTFKIQQRKTLAISRRKWCKGFQKNTVVVLALTLLILQVIVNSQMKMIREIQNNRTILVTW